MRFNVDPKRESAVVQALCQRLEEQKDKGATSFTVTQAEHDLLRKWLGEHYSGPTQYLGLPVVVA